MAATTVCMVQCSKASRLCPMASRQDVHPKCSTSPLPNRILRWHWAKTKRGRRRRTRKKKSKKELIAAFLLLFYLPAYTRPCNSCARDSSRSRHFSSSLIRETSDKYATSVQPPPSPGSERYQLSHEGKGGSPPVQQSPAGIGAGQSLLDLRHTASYGTFITTMTLHLYACLCF